MKYERGAFSAEVTSVSPPVDPPVIVVLKAPKAEWKKILDYLGESNSEQVAYEAYGVLRDALAGVGVNEY